MAYSINTNITSLQAQDYLRQTQEFQSKTIQRVTSGLRIVSSGDDAAGLAIANGFRSDLAVLNQGVRNANDGLSTLQTIDGGINNISKLLDRARTLATQSASSTFSGDRSVLNDEFQSVMGEVDRQSQAIGMDKGGQFAKALSVFIGGGKANNGLTTIDNGSVSIDLSNSTVDTTSLGLKGVAAVGAAKNLDVPGVVSANSLGAGVKTTFYFSGAGFSDAGKVAVQVDPATFSNNDTLVTALNAAIAAAGTGASTSVTAFKNANISAYINTAKDGSQQLAFRSGSGAFQVQAGDVMANALLGKSDAGNVGTAIATTVKSTGTFTAATTAANNATLQVRLIGAGMSAPVVKQISVTAGDTAATVAGALQTAITGDATLKGAGITMSTPTNGQQLTFTSSHGDKFDVQVMGDTENLLGMGAFIGSGTTGDYTTLTAAANYPPTAGSVAAGASTTTMEFSINGAASSANTMTIDLNGGDAQAATIQGSGATLATTLPAAATITGGAGNMTPAGPLIASFTGGVATMANPGAAIATITGGAPGSASDVTAQAGQKFNLFVDGADHSVTLDSGDVSLADIAADITAHAGGGVNASVDSSGHLVLTATAAGPTHSIKVTNPGGGGDADMIKLGLAAAVGNTVTGHLPSMDAGKSFHFSVDGVDKTFSFAATDKTLGDYAADITSHSGGGLVASVDSAGTRLVLTSTGAGATHKFQITDPGGGGDADLADLGLAGAVSLGEVAGNAPTTNSGKTLVIKVDGTDKNFALGATSSTLADFAKDITAAGNGVNASVDSSNHLVLTATAKGLTHTLQVMNTGTAVVADLGLTAAVGLGSVTGNDPSTDANKTLVLKVNGTNHTVTFDGTPATLADYATEITNQSNAWGASGADKVIASIDHSGNLVLNTAAKGAGASVEVVAAGTTSTLADFGVSADGPHYGVARTGADIQQEINDKFAADPEMAKAGLHATYSGTQFTISTGTTGTAFRMAAFSANTGNLGFGKTGATFTGNTIAVAKSSVVDSGGASNTASLDFTALSYGSENQTITVSGNDSTGALHATSIKLQNIAGNTSGRSIEEALTAINTALQSSNDTTLQKVSAVRETDASGNEKINFLSTLPSFNVSVGTSAYGDGLASLDSANTRVQGTTVTSATLAGGSTADISNQTTAQNAVNALATAVSNLGTAQAAVGKGQNQFNYAINLASTQITNISAAESGIRDADLAAEAANLTKAQILQQAGVAALAQANSAPQAILSLLKG